MFQNKVSERPFNKNLNKLGNYVAKKGFYYSFYGADTIVFAKSNKPPPPQISPLSLL